MSQLAIKNLKTDDRIKNLNLKEGKKIYGGDIVIFYEDGTAVVITTPLVGVFDLTEDGRFSQ
jgi:hypothetical protein